MPCQLSCHVAPVIGISSPTKYSSRPFCVHIALIIGLYCRSNCGCVTFSRLTFRYIFYISVFIAQVDLNSPALLQDTHVHILYVTLVRTSRYDSLAAKNLSHIAYQGHLEKIYVHRIRDWSTTILLYIIFCFFLQHVSGFCN